MGLASSGALLVNSEMRHAAPALRFLAVFSLFLVSCRSNALDSKDKDPVIGDWWWRVSDRGEGKFHGPKVVAYNGYLVDVKTEEDNDARRPDARVAGFWKAVDRKKRKYLLTWQDPWNTFTDTLVLSEDGNYLKGTNDNGRLIEGVRVGW